MHGLEHYCPISFKTDRMPLLLWTVPYYARFDNMPGELGKSGHPCASAPE